MPIKENAILVNLKTGTWQLNVLDHEATKQVERQYNAQDGAGRYLKRLLSTEATRDIQLAAYDARRVHLGLTLYWDKGKYRLLPIRLYETYKEQMDKIIERRIDSRNVLVEKYDSYIEEAKTRLGRMFDLSLYPHVNELASRIMMNYHFCPVPDADHFRSTLFIDGEGALKSQIEAQIRADMEGEIQKRTQAVVADLHNRFAQEVAKLQDKMQIEEVTNDEGEEVSMGKVFRDSALGNMTEFLTLLPDLNVTDEPVFNELAREGQEVLADVTSNELRVNHKTFSQDKHDKVTEKFAEIENRLSGYFGEV